MRDPEVDRIDAEISRLNQEREERLRALADPKRKEIRAQYEIIRQALRKLEELGDDTDNGDGFVVTVTGKTFHLSGSGPVEEV